MRPTPGSRMRRWGGLAARLVSLRGAGRAFPAGTTPRLLAAAKQQQRDFLAAFEALDLPGDPGAGGADRRHEGLGERRRQGPRPPPGKPSGARRAAAIPPEAEVL